MITRRSSPTAIQPGGDPLEGEIETARANIKTDEYAISIVEWTSVYTDDELDIHPEFKRYF